MSDSKLHVPSAVVAALLVGALANVAQFPQLEMATSDWYEAVRVKEGHDLRTLVEGHFGSTQERFSLHLQLRDLAPGVEVVLPADATLYPEQLVGLAAASGVTRASGPLTLDAEAAAALDRFVVARGENREIGPYALALPQDGDVEQVVVLAGPDLTWVVAGRLLGELGIAWDGAP